MDTVADEADAKGFERVASYGIGIFPYEGLYVGFNWLFQITELQANGYQDGFIEVGLMVKKGKFTNDWQRPYREPLIPRGSAGDWDAGMVTTSSTALVVNDEIWLYYSGFPKSHMAENNVARIGLAKWRLDGFVSINANNEEGYFVSKPLHFAGQNLFINADIASGGYVKAELLNRNNQVIGEYSKENFTDLTGDSIRHLSSWKSSSNLQSLEGKVIKVKFYLKNAKMYSYYFK